MFYSIFSPHRYDVDSHACLNFLGDVGMCALEVMESSVAKRDVTSRSPHSHLLVHQNFSGPAPPTDQVRIV